MSGYGIDWSVLSALAAVLSAAMALLQGFGVKMRNVIVYSKSAVEGTIPLIVQDKPGKRLMAERFIFSNNGLKHLEMIELRLAGVNEVWSVQATSASSTDPSVINHTINGHDIKLDIPHLPRGEKIAVDVVSVGWPHGATVKGGSSAFKLTEQAQFRADRVASTILFAGAAVLLFFLGH